MKITICRDAGGFYTKDLLFSEDIENRLIRKMLKSQHIPIIKKGEELIVNLWFRNPRIKAKKEVGDEL